MDFPTKNLLLCVAFTASIVVGHAKGSGIMMLRGSGDPADDSDIIIDDDLGGDKGLQLTTTTKNVTKKMMDSSPSTPGRQLAVRGGGDNKKRDFCWLPTSVRGVGTIPQNCAPGYTRIGLLCYKDCPAGYKRNIFDCVAECPDGYRDDGAYCRRAEFWRGNGYAIWDKSKCERKHGGRCEQCLAMWYKPCPSGYHLIGCNICRPQVPNCGAVIGNGSYNVDLSCSKPIITRHPQLGVCDPGYERDAGLCYKACPAGYHPVGPVCWGTPPPEWVRCGLGAATDKQTCTKVIMEQIVSIFKAIFETVKFIFSAGATTAITAAKTVMNAFSAVQATAEMVKKLKQLLKKGKELEKLAPEVYEVIEYTRGEIRKLGYQAPMSRADRKKAEGVTTDTKASVVIKYTNQLVSLYDPTGVAAAWMNVAEKFNYPLCTEYFGNYVGATVDVYDVYIDCHNTEQGDIIKSQASTENKIVITFADAKKVVSYLPFDGTKCSASTMQKVSFTHSYNKDKGETPIEAFQIGIARGGDDYFIDRVLMKKNNKYQAYGDDNGDGLCLSSNPTGFGGKPCKKLYNYPLAGPGPVVASRVKGSAEARGTGPGKVHTITDKQSGVGAQDEGGAEKADSIIVGISDIITDKHWTKQNGVTARDVGGSPDGTYWVVSNESDGAIDFLIYRFWDGEWVKVKGSANRVSVGNEENILIVTKEGKIKRWDEGISDWESIPIPERARDASITSDGTIWMTTKNGGKKSGKIYLKKAWGGWTAIPGGGDRISAASAEKAALCNQNGNIYVYHGAVTGWKLGGKCKAKGDISIDPNGSTLWAINENGYPCRSPDYGRTWDAAVKATTGVSVAGSNENGFFIATKSHNLYQYYNSTT